jgi:Glycosyl transferase family 2
VPASTFPQWHIRQSAYGRWITEVENPFCKALEVTSGPLISIVLATFNTHHPWLRQALESVLRQRYQHWQLCICDDASTDPGVVAIIEEYRRQDSRILLCRRSDNGGISAATNNALQMAQGQYIAFMDHDDCLPDHALACVASFLESQPQARLLYSDSDHLDDQGRRCRPFFKPDFNYELLLGQNYLNHLTLMAAELVQQLGGLRSELDGSQDYDLVLRAIERLDDNQVAHLPQVLYHWREAPTSVSRTDIASAARAARAAVQQHLERRGINAVVQPAVGALIYNQVSWPPGTPAPRMLVMSAGDSEKSAADAAAELRRHTEPGNVSCVGWNAQEQSAAEFLAAQLRNWKPCGNELVCIVPPGVSPKAPDWAGNLAAMAAREDCGCVEAAIRGVASENILNPPQVDAPVNSTAVGSLARYWGPGKGYFAGMALGREVSFAAGGVLVFKLELWLQLQDEADFPQGLEQLYRALSLASHRAGLRNLWTPSIEFTAPESAVARPSLSASPASESLYKDLNYHPALAYCRAIEGQDQD